MHILSQQVKEPKRKSEETMEEDTGTASLPLMRRARMIWEKEYR